MTGSFTLPRSIQLKGRVQCAHSQLQVFLFDDHRNLDFRCGDHLDIDALLGQRFEHATGNAGMRAHADADDGHLGDLGIAGHFTRADFTCGGLKAA